MPEQIWRQSDCEERKEEVGFESEEMGFEEELLLDEDSDSEFERRNARNTTHSATNAKNKYKYYDIRRTDVRFIDFSNLHPLSDLIPIQRRQGGKV